MTQTWIILGASSAMARAFGREMAQEGHHLLVCGRDTEDLRRNAADLLLRGASEAEVFEFDTRDAQTWQAILDRAASVNRIVNVAVFAGSMPEQDSIATDPALMQGVVLDNFSGAAEFLLRIAPIMESHGRGSVVGLGSVAGDRGRLGNYVYGAAKAGFHTFMAGHRNRMARSGVHVMTVKPGFVDTAMTWGLEGMFLVASPEAVARDIVTGLRKKRNVIYTPMFWFLIMTIIRCVPEFIFKRLKI